VAEDITEEEQIEALKRWWAENGMQTVLAVVLVIGGYFGWQFWGTHQQEKMTEASDVYREMIDVIAGQQPGSLLTDTQQAQVNAIADQLKDDYSSSAYAQFGALVKAKLAVDANDLDKAATELQWALDANPEAPTERLIRLRMARVESARGNIDEALKMVQTGDPAEMKSAYEEAKGDFYLQQGNSAAAFTAYQSALLSDESTDQMVSNLLQLKMSAVLPAEVAIEEAVSEGDSQ
jgi:predicted negative regulator of RcsB-dependent stress response